MQAKTQTCKYCKREFKATSRSSRPRVTCGQPACLKARKKELHLAYMRPPGPKEKNKAFQKEYIRRPEVAKRVKKYLKKYAARKKAEAGWKPLQPRLCPFCLKSYSPKSNWEAVHCSKALCKRKWSLLKKQLEKSGRVVVFLQDAAPVQGKA